MPPSSAHRTSRAKQQARKDTEALFAAAATSELAQLSNNAAGAVTAAQRLAAAGADSAETTALILTLLAALAAARGGTEWIPPIMEVEFADQLRSGELTDPELVEAAETEREREAAFIQGMERRLKRDIPEALKQTDPSAAVDAIIEREQRYMDQHDDAAAARVQALLKRRLVKKLSPEGAYWILNPTVETHTPDCLALAAVGWWPWDVLDRINPPIHTGCRCDLLTRDEAIGMGYMGPELPDTTDAVEKARQIELQYELGEAEWRYEPPLDERDLMELFWNRRYPKGCHDEQTEVLTDQGWLGLADLRELSDAELPPTAAFDPETGELRYEKPTALYLVEGYAGELLHYSGRGQDIAVTPGHRMVVQRHNPRQGTLGPPSFEHAGDLPTNASHIYHRRAAVLADAPERETFTLPAVPAREWNRAVRQRVEALNDGRTHRQIAEVVGRSRQQVSLILRTQSEARRRDREMLPAQTLGADNFLRWLGWFISEGDTRTGSSNCVRIRQALDSPDLKAVKAACRSLGLPGSESIADGAWRWSLRSPKQMNRWLRDNVGTDSFDKRLPDWVWTTSRRQQMLLLESLMAGDGTTPKGWQTHGKSRYHTVSEHLADDVQRLAINCGFVATKVWLGRIWVINMHHGARVNRGLGRLPKPRRETYSGAVWCLVMPSGTLVTRRNGCVAMHGNTIWGGRFMPKRGGFAPRISISEILRRLMGTDAPDVVSRGNQRTIAAPDPVDVMRTPSTGGEGRGRAQDGEKLQDVVNRTAKSLEGKVTELGQTMGPVWLNPMPTRERGGERSRWRDPETGIEGSAVTIGSDHIDDLERLTAKQARGEALTPEESFDLYEAYRVVTHELIHGASAISNRDYRTEEGFAIEEAITEELAHVRITEGFVESQNIDVLRVMEDYPDDMRLQGVYRIQRAGLRKVLDLARVPEEDRREILEQLSFGTPTTEGRIALLGKLLADANGISQQKGEDAVRGAMYLAGDAAGPDRDRLVGFFDAPDLKGILTPQPVLPEGLPDEELPADGFELGDVVIVTGRGENDRSRDFFRYSGRIVDLSPGTDGPTIGVEVPEVDANGNKIGTQIRYPNPPDIQKLSSIKRTRLKGPNVTGPVQKGDQVRILRNNGDLEVVKLDQIVALSKNGYTIDVKTEMGQRVRIRSTEIKDLQRAKASTRSRKAPRAPKEKVPGGARRVKAQDVSGPLGYDPRRHRDPRRTLLSKVAAMTPGDELDLADGSTVKRGVKGLATIERPDGSRRVYASPARLANAEAEGVARRVGSRVTMNTPSDGDPFERGTPAFRNRQDAALDEAVMLSPSYSPGDDHELVVGTGLMEWQNDPDLVDEQQLAAIGYEVANAPAIEGPFYRGQPTDAPAPPQSGRIRGWSEKLNEAVAFALMGPAIVDEDGRRRRIEGGLTVARSEIAPGEKLIVTLYVADGGGGIKVGQRIDRAEESRVKVIQERVDSIAAERLPELRDEYVGQLFDEANKPALEAARDALGLPEVEASPGFPEPIQSLRPRIKESLAGRSDDEIERAIEAMDEADPLRDLGDSRVRGLNNYIADQMDEFEQEALEEVGGTPLRDEYENEAEVILDNDRLNGLRRVDVLVGEGGDPELTSLTINGIRSMVQDAIESGDTYQLPDPPADVDAPPPLPDQPDFDSAVAMGASDSDFEMDDFTKGIMSKHGLMPGGGDNRDLSPDEEALSVMATPSTLEKLTDGEGPVEDLLRRALDSIGVDPYDVDFDKLNRHALDHEMLPESRLEVADRGISPCATFRSVDFAVHVLLPEMLAEKYPELANKLRSTSPRWGWRTGDMEPGIAQPVKDATLDEVMQTPSDGAPVDEFELKRVVQRWTSWADDVRSDPEAMDMLRRALDNAPEVEGPFFRGQTPDQPEPTEGVRGWSSDVGIAADFAGDFGLELRRPDGTTEPVEDGLLQRVLDDLKPGEELVATVFVVDSAEGLNLPEIMKEPMMENDPHYDLNGEWMWAKEGEHILKPETLKGYRKVEVVLARHGEYFPISDPAVRRTTIRRKVRAAVESDSAQSMATPSDPRQRAKDAALDAAMATPSVDVQEPIDPEDLRGVLRGWSNDPDAIRSNPKSLELLQRAVKQGDTVRGPFFRGQPPNTREPTEGVRGWSKDPEIAAQFALRFGVVRRDDGGAEIPFFGSGVTGMGPQITQQDIDALEEGEDLIVEIHTADRGTGIEMNAIMGNGWRFAYEQESILDGQSLQAYKSKQIVIAEAGEQLGDDIRRVLMDRVMGRLGGQPTRLTPEADRMGRPLPSMETPSEKAPTHDGERPSEMATPSDPEAMQTPSDRERPPSIEERVADQLDAKWDRDEGMIEWPDGQRVFLDVNENYGTLELMNIRAEPEGTGAGSRVLKALQSLGMPIRANEVMNPEFFDRHGFRVDEDYDPELYGMGEPDRLWSPGDTDSAMQTPSFDLFSWTKKNRPGRENQVKRSELERPPAPVQGIPSYEGIALTDVEAAGGSNGARIAVDENGNSWLVKPYRGDADRVATELLSNAVYRELGVRVPNAGIGMTKGPDGDQIAVSYPLIAGEIKSWDEPDAELADGFVADALLANWDVIGLTQDNILWNNDQPIRLDQGGTLEFRAQGGAKPYGPLPAELWTMLGVEGQARGRMDITEEGMRASARDAALRLPPERIDQLVDNAPFADEDMRERVRQSLKDRVAWLDRYGRGLEGLPEPLETDQAIDYLDERDGLLLTDPEQDAAIAEFMGDMREPVEKHLQANAPQSAATPEVQEIVKRLDQVLRSADTELDDDMIAFAPLPRLDNPDNLTGRMVTERSFLPLDLRPDAEADTVLRLQVPSGTNVISPSALGVVTDPEAILLGRNSRIQITSAVELPDGRTQLNGEIVPFGSTSPTPIEMLSRSQLLAALGLEDSSLTDTELRDRLRLKRGDA